MGLFGSKEDNSEPEPEWEECRLVAEFERKTVKLHFDSGESQKVVYDKTYSSSSSEQLYIIEGVQKLGRMSIYNRSVPFEMEKIGLLNMELFPYIQYVNREPKCLVFEGAEKRDGDIRIRGGGFWEWIDGYNPKDGDYQVEIRRS